jgi:phytoene desaturase
MRVAVVGAGLGGLSAAAHLVAAGHRVNIFERSPAPGGRAATDVEAGFRLPLGPTVLTMPSIVAEAFGALGADLEREVAIAPLDPTYRAVFADGSELRVRRDREAMVEEVREFAGPREAANFEAFADWLTRLYEIEMPHFIDTQWDGVGDLRDKWRPLYRLLRTAGVRRLDQAVASFLEEPRLQRVFSFQSMYAGISPQEAMSLYSVITYMDSVAGVYEVRGGLSTIAVTLANLLRRKGVEFEYDSPVSRIMRGDGGAVSGVEVGGDRRVDFDAVVCNADLPVAYRTLLDVRPPRAVRKGRFAPACALWSAGVRGIPAAGTEHHNIHFGWEWDDAFAALDRGVRMPDPSTFVTVASITDPTVAPEGHSTIYALEPVPNLAGKVDWTSEADRHVATMRERLAGFGYPVDAVVVERFLDPLAWRALGLELGTPFSLAHSFSQTGPLRPRNVDDRIPGLAFVGGATTPGVGVPMVMLSGRLAAQRIEQYAVETRTVRW